MEWHTGWLGGAGVRLWGRWTDTGRPLVVLAHGITDSAACWRRLAEHLYLNADVDVLAYDARGHGRSDRGSDYSFRAHLEDLLALRRSREAADWALVGHSMGGAQVTAAAGSLPTWALAVIDPHWPELPEDESSYDVAAWRLQVTRESTLQLTDVFHQGRAHHPRWNAADLEAWAKAKLAVDPDVTSWVTSHADLNDWRARLRTVKSPLMIVTGDKSADPHVTVTRTGVQAATELVAQVTELHVEGAGHSVHRDDFATVATGLATFLRRHRPGHEAGT